MSVPSYAVLFRGRWACPCLAEWIPLMEKVAIKRGIIKQNVDIAQLIGGAPQSGGTHTRGGCGDFWQHTSAFVALCEEMGAAAFARTVAQGFSPHTHLILNGCPHNIPARYQIAAREAGYNGLGAGGRGGRDPRGKKTLRTFKQGITWAKSQLVVTDPLEEVMAMYKNKAEFEAAIAKAANKGVLESDSIGIEEPVATAANIKKNPTWKFRSAVVVILREVFTVRNEVRALSKKVDRLLGDEAPKA